MINRLGSAYRWVLQPLLVVAILATGFFAAKGLASGRTQPPAEQPTRYAPVVRVLKSELRDHSIVLRSHGALQPQTRVQLVPQVGGRVLAIHSGLRPGGTFSAGETLVEIESIDYELALERAQADVAGAQTALATAEAEAKSARAEWQALRPDEEIPDLVARVPQITEAKARIRAAEAAVRSARLDLERTSLKLPFDGRVVSANVDVGDVVLAGQAVASVYGTRTFEIPVTMDEADLDWIRIPDGSENSRGSAARVKLGSEGAALQVEGEVVRLAAEVDTRTRLAAVIVAVNGADLSPARRLRFLPGTFVDTEIEGQVLERVTALPRAALREGGQIWTVNPAGDSPILEMLTPIQRYAEGDTLYVSGIPDGTWIVTSNLEVVTNGMHVRLAEQGQ